MVLTADKGVEMVLLDKEEYRKKGGKPTRTVSLQDHRKASNQQDQGKTHPNHQKNKKENRFCFTKNP